MKKVISLLFALFILAPSISAGKFRDAAFPLLQRFNAELVKYQVCDVASPDFGAISCPACLSYHTRAGEAVFPLAYEYSQTYNGERLRQVLALSDWLIARQQPDGSWAETPDSWTGTTVDQLLMLLYTYPLIERKLSRNRKTLWQSAMMSASDYICTFIDNHRASINYCATASLALAEAWKRFGNGSYLDRSRELANLVVSKMNGDYFIEGEGGRERGYRYGVDIGYDLEMSLWALAAYALITDDNYVMDAVRKSTENHLAFLYPDGTMDGSIGVRSNKWTIYGSGTSDGCHPLFALLSDGHPEYVEAAIRNISCIEKCFSKNGLLGRGPDHDSVDGGVPCVYPTFAKAKSLALALLWMKQDIDAPVMLPSDRDSCIYFRSLETAIVRKGPFRGTVTAYGYKSKLGSRSKNMYRPSGGALSLLWAEGFGLVQASSQTEYIRWEPLNFPDIRDTETLTPRIVCKSDTVCYTNLFDFDAVLSMGEGSDVTCSGSLKDKEGFFGGVMYEINYLWEDSSLVKTYHIIHQTNSDPVEIIEPVIWNEDIGYKVLDSRNVIFSRDGISVKISAYGHDLVIDADSAARYRQPYPSLRAIPLKLISSPEASRRDTLTLRFELIGN